MNCTKCGGVFQARETPNKCPNCKHTNGGSGGFVIRIQQAVPNKQTVDAGKKS